MNYDYSHHFMCAPHFEPFLKLNKKRVKRVVLDVKWFYECRKYDFYLLGKQKLTLIYVFSCLLCGKLQQQNESV